MADPNAVFQNCYYVGNNFNAILYGEYWRRISEAADARRVYHR